MDSADDPEQKRGLIQVASKLGNVTADEDV
jgi:hypothetical protein